MVLILFVTGHKTEIQLSACGGRHKLRLLVVAVAAAQNHNQIAVLLINHMQYVLASISNSFHEAHS